MSILETFRLLCKDFSDVGDEEVSNYLSIFAPMVSKKKFRSNYNLALVYYVAHKMAMDGLGKTSENSLGAAISVSDVAAYSAAGVTAVKDGETSISFLAGSSESGKSGADAEYEKTVYGRQYMAIRDSCIVPITIS